MAARWKAAREPEPGGCWRRRGRARRVL